MEIVLLWRRRRLEGTLRTDLGELESARRVEVESRWVRETLGETVRGDGGILFVVVGGGGLERRICGLAVGLEVGVALPLDGHTNLSVHALFGGSSFFTTTASSTFGFSSVFLLLASSSFFLPPQANIIHLFLPNPFSTASSLLLATGVAVFFANGSTLSLAPLNLIVDWPLNDS